MSNIMVAPRGRNDRHRSRWRALVGFLPLLFILIEGCVQPSTGPESSNAANEPWSFTLAGTGVVGSARLGRTGGGQAIGPDLQVHEADFFDLQSEIHFAGGVIQDRWLIAVWPNTTRIMSMYTACAAFIPSDTTRLGCADAGEVRIPIGDEALFFGIPLFLDHIGPDEFEVEVWEAGRQVPVRFNTAPTDQGLEVRMATRQRVVEHGYLEDSGESSGSVLDCDAFERDRVVIGPDTWRCHDAGKDWVWETRSAGVPGIRPVGGAIAPPIQPMPAAHGKPPGSDALPFPLGDALQSVMDAKGRASELMNEPDWMLGDYRYTLVAGFGIGPLSCRTYEWELVISTRAGAAQEARTRREVCNEGIHVEPDEVTEMPGGQSHRYPTDATSVPLDRVLERTASRLLCEPALVEDVVISSYVRPYADGNKTWLYVGAGVTNSVLINAGTGYILGVTRQPEAGALETLFREGEGRPCPQ